MWEYQVELNPNQTKNIWLINGTYSIAPLYQSSLVLVNNGTFPPVYPSPTPTMTPSVTPTNTPTPSVTATNTPTPSITASQTPTNTATQTPTNTTSQTPTPTTTTTLTASQTPTMTVTPTPTNIVRTTLGGICHDESNPNDACDCLGTATLFVNGSNMADSTLAWSDQFGVNTGDPVGYYVQSGVIYSVDGNCGVGCITGSTISVYGNCPTPTPTNTGTAAVTPTPTPTNTPTNTGTPTNTPTVTNTPTHARFTFSAITSGATSNVACDSGVAGTIYGDEAVYDQNTQFYNSLVGSVTIDMSGYYANSGDVVQLDTDGTIMGAFTLCSILPTLTQTPTNTATPTNTSTMTPTPTPTIGYYVYSLGYDAGSSSAACLATPSNYYLAPNLNPLDVGDTIYTDTTLSTTAPNGYYSDSTNWYQVTGGAGLITSSLPGGC
jgi:hypothetical protein